ncbi:MAG: flavin reductase [Rhizobiales bacterium NRL2]|jgi:flavin reductase (DIM6/NTAB) family NADH-FMN oxidoreductase RutF|nr:MAG: flavin reductase [Rhizobiales bacterium NRL2]
MFYRADQDHGLKHNPFKALVAPRPIGWISTRDRNGGFNLAPFSYFNAITDYPPTVVFGCNGPHPEGDTKDTAANARDTGEFVVNMATWELREQMNRSSAHVPRDVDEFREAGLTALESEMVSAPRVKESPVNLECRLVQVIQLRSSNPKITNNMVIGEVVGIHIDERIIKDGMIDMPTYRPIARLGYMDYTVVEKVFTMDRPD